MSTQLPSTSPIREGGEAIVHPSNYCSPPVIAAALLAIAAATVGLMIIGNQLMGDFVGLGAMNWPIGGAAVASGILAGFILVVNKCRSTPVEGIREILPSQLKERESQDEEIRRLNLNSNQVLIKVLDELNIADLDAHIDENYTWHDRPYHLRFEKNETVIRLYLFTSDQLMALPLAEIENYSAKAFKVLLERLELEEFRTDLINIKLTSQESDLVTLGELLAMSAEDFTRYNIPKKCRGLLRFKQLDALLSSGVALPFDVNDFFPPHYSYSYCRLHDLCGRKDVQTGCSGLALKAHLKDLGCEQLRFIRPHYFKEPDFPWERVTESRESLAKVLGTSSTWSFGQLSDAGFTTVVFQQVGDDRLFKLSRHLSPEHLPLLPPTFLQRPDFPWEHFLSQKDIAKSLRKISSEVLAGTHLSWNSFAGKTEAIKTLFLPFSTKERDDKENGKAFTQTIFQSLDFETIEALAADLTHQHLPLFSIPQLQHEEFPWSIFLKKEGVGKFMHQEMRVEWLTSEHIPWDLMEQNEIDDLLPTGYNVGRTRELLGAMHFDGLKLLHAAGKLNSEHHKLYKEKAVFKP